MRIVIACSLALLLSIPAASACTTFLLEKGDKRLIGKSYDWGQDAGLVLINKKDMKKKALTLIPGDNPAQWTSKYASVTFNQYGREMPNGGMNTQGLVVEIMWLNASQYPAQDKRPALGELQWIQYQLDNYATVKEVVAGAPSLRVSPIYAKVHYLVCDKGGDCAAFEYIGGRLVVHEGARTLTNNTYAQSRKYQRRLRGTVPTGPGSLNRYARAHKACQEGKQEPFQILDSVQQGDYTKWSIVYDPAALSVSFKTLRRPDVKTVRLSAFDAGCGSPVKMIDMNTPQTGDVTAHLIDYTSEANRGLLKQSTAPIADSLPPGAVWVLGGYPNLSECTAP